jgi:Zn-dependent protease
MLDKLKAGVQSVKDRLPSTEKVFEVCRWFNVQLTTAFGITTTIHWSVLLMLGVGLLINPEWAGVMALGLLSVVPHEYGHALAARCYKIKTARIVIYPIGGIAFLVPSLKNHMTHWRELWVAAAGPLVSAALALFGMAAYFATGLQFWFYLGVINVILTVFNLIPAFPMDGGRILRAVLETWFDHVRATRYCLNVSYGFAVVGIVFGLLTMNLSLIIMAMFILTLGKHELAAAEYRAEMMAKQAAKEEKKKKPPEERIFLDV